MAKNWKDIQHKGETEFKMERECGCKITEGKISLDVHSI